MTADVQQMIETRRLDILARIEKAATSAQRDPAHISLVAVSKVQPDDRVDAMLATGQRVFGENRVQEAQTRWGERRALYPDLELRLIGPLQTNKADDAVALFDVIETLDRPKLAGALSAAMQKAGKKVRVFVQVNTGEEDQKSGALPDDVDALISVARDQHGLDVAGLMCIPPADEAPGPHFALLASIAARNNLSELSMGMSGDFESAVLFGATHVRVGTSLFGDRI